MCIIYSGSIADFIWQRSERTPETAFCNQYQCAVPFRTRNGIMNLRFWIFSKNKFIPVFRKIPWFGSVIPGQPCIGVVSEKFSLRQGSMMSTQCYPLIRCAEVREQNMRNQHTHKYKHTIHYMWFLNLIFISWDWTHKQTQLLTSDQRNKKYFLSLVLVAFVRHKQRFYAEAEKIVVIRVTFFHLLFTYL